MNDTETFVTESNRIEGITRKPTTAELAEHERFMALEVVTVEELERFVHVYQPNARLRDQHGLDVRVGNHIPPRGGPEIRERLQALLECCENIGSHWAHLEYETIHPFTDGNGRSGRMLWAWQKRDYPLGFLHHFYYETLQAHGKRQPNSIDQTQLSSEAQVT